MGTMRGGSVLLVACFLICNTLIIEAFKENDFKKCKDLGFCRRHRGKRNYDYSVVPNSVATSSDAVTATILNGAAGKQFSLSLTAYDGVLRMKVDEAPSTNRYQVTDVLMPDLETRRVALGGVSQTGTTTSFMLGDASVRLTYQPFKLDISISGSPAIEFNSRNMFSFEHTRAKEEGVEGDGDWAETFLGHTDTKPRGPQAVSFDLTFPGSQHLYGLPEHATDMVLRPTVSGDTSFLSEPYRLYNLDVFEYLHDSPFGLYGSIPFMLAHKPALTVGAFWLNSAEMLVDVSKVSGGSSSQWISESGILDLFFMIGPAPHDVMAQYASLTGPSAMPQLFALGYHQCRWNYKDEADTRMVDAGFDEHAMPYDVLWLDIEHTNGKRYLTWDTSKFPDPAAMISDIASRGRMMVTIVDPHVKRDHSYNIFQAAEQKGYYVKDRSGNDFDGWCWPGASSYLDVTNPEVRDWWADQFALDKYLGSTASLYIWNDMNEPSVFNGPEITMPKDNLHFNGTEHRDVHNLYGLLYHMATAQGLEQRGLTTHRDGDRPFVLSRAFFAGTQRVGPIWTGDNAASWEHLRVSVPMLLTLGMTGLPFSGADVGGFFGNPDPELLVRWYQMGAYYPFFRGHAHLETERREPWLFGEPHTSRIRRALHARYAHLPYIYTLFRHANLTGAPVLRPLWYEFPDNKDTFSEQSQFMLGPGLMVAPVTAPGLTSLDVLLPPASRWYDAATGAEAVKEKGWRLTSDSKHRVALDMERVPTYVRGGHILPLKERPRRSSAAMRNDPLTLVVALDKGQAAVGDIYIDDGHSYAFARGQYVHRLVKFEDGKLRCSQLSRPGMPGQEYAANVAVERVVFLGLAPGSTYKATLPSGKVVELEQGPASQAFPTHKHALVLRAPGLSIADDWVVQVSV